MSFYQPIAPAGASGDIQLNLNSGFGVITGFSWVSGELQVPGDIKLDDGGTYATTVQMVTPTANRTISFPDATGTVALVAGSSGQVTYNNAGAQAGLSTLTTDGTDITLTGRFISSLNGAASEPPGAFTGTWFTGGTATTTKPQVLIEPTGTTSTAWSTSGTGLGINAASGFAGNLLDLQINGSSKAVVDSSGRLLVGRSSARSVGSSFNGRLQIEVTDYVGISVVNNKNDSGGSAIALGKSRGNSIGASTIVQSGDDLGVISFAGADGTDLQTPGASITAQVDGTPGANDMPGRLVFSTTADGASSPTERMRISQDGRTTITRNTNGGATLVADNTANTSTDEGIQVLFGANAIASTSAFIVCAQKNIANRFVVLGTGNVQNTNNSYGAISDLKLKENIVDAASQWSDIKALQVRKYNFKEGQTHTQIGLVAQEVELVSPGLVTESPDRDADGNDLGTVTKSVNYSVLYMKAVKALQEAMERIETLEAKVAALEAS